jgi:hypothetical protein
LVSPSKFGRRNNDSPVTLPHDIITDFVSMPYKYELDDKDDWDESNKANPDYIMRDDWPFNYVLAIKQAMNNDKILPIKIRHWYLSKKILEDLIDRKFSISICESFIIFSMFYYTLSLTTL